MQTVEKEERFLRQLDILKPEVCQQNICIIGAGATGSFTALLLAKMGFENIVVFDGDSIEEHNFPNQLFPEEAKGMNKALALEKMVKYFTGVTITAIPRMYTNEPLSGIVISALDSMTGRKTVYDNCKNNREVVLLVDSRTGPEHYRVLTIDMSVAPLKEFYESTFFKDEDADPVPCTGRAIIYSVSKVSAEIASSIKKFQMRQPYKKDVCEDMRHNFITSI